MTTSKNDITGDTLKSKATSELYRNNYDAIFSPKEAECLVTQILIETLDVAKAPTKTPNTVKTLK